MFFHYGISKLIQGSEVTISRVAFGNYGIYQFHFKITEHTLDLDAQGLDVEFIQSGCMTVCYAEPTVEISLPCKEPVVFGYVDVEKAKTLVQKYVKAGELVDGVIPAGYERVVL